MPTRWKRFRRNLPNKFPEWICSLVLLAIGMICLLSPESFQRPEMAAFVKIMGPQQWTALFLSVGLWRVVSMALNGEFPVGAGLMRVAGSVAGCTLYGACVGRSFEASTAASVSWGVALYTAFFVMDIRNAIRSSADTFNAWRKVTNVAPVVW